MTYFTKLDMEMEVVGGMLDHENSQLRDRVTTLEKHIQQQDDEIICLKSALADCLRRLQSIEAGRALQNNLLPSKPNLKTPRKASGSSSSAHHREPHAPTHHQSNGRLSTRHHSSDTSPGAMSPSRSSASSPQSNRVVSRVTTSSQPNLPKKSGSISRSNSNVHSEASSQHVSTVNHQTSSSRRTGSLGNLPLASKAPVPITARHREPSYNAEEGCMRFYLRGRPLTLYAPSDVANYEVSKIGEAPQENLKLEWVYGYRGRDARSNLFLLPTGEIIYFVASVVVLYNVEEQMQRHYIGHTDDVKCIAVHPDKITVATGQVAGHEKREGKLAKSDMHLLETGENLRGNRKLPKNMQPHIRIWDSVSLNTLRVIGIGDFERAVACVGFSKLDGGQYLVAVDESNEHVISLWDWQNGEKGHKITETKSSTEPVLCAEFHPCEEHSIITCGKNQLSFWNIEGNTLTRKLGLFERNEKPKFVTCIAFAENGDVLSGDSSGNFFVWARGTNKIAMPILNAHEGGIFSICVMKDGHILTGGKDRRIVQWDMYYRRTGNEHEIPEQYGPVRMLSQGKGNMVLVGTTKNCILQGTIDLKFSPIVQGHLDELWGLSTHPNQHQFVTCGYDKNLYLWDTLSRSAIWCMEMPDGCHCSSFHPEGSVVAVGTLASKWYVVDIETRDILVSFSDGNEAIECIAFSPDGMKIALGSRDNYIYIYTCSEAGRKFSRTGRCSGHSSFVTHIDWSDDSEILQSNSGDYELLFWNATTCKQITSASSMRDIVWATQTCTLGFNVCGIWPEGADGTDVNACGRSGKLTCLATADDFGKVNLFKYPSCQPKSSCHTYGGHSSHVTNVKFIFDDTRLLSTGGKDTAILQWEVLEQ